MYRVIALLLPVAVSLFRLVLKVMVDPHRPSGAKPASLLGRLSADKAAALASRCSHIKIRSEHSFVFPTKASDSDLDPAVDTNLRCAFNVIRIIISPEPQEEVYELI